jgi:acetate CoA/acetoacetate CoA-transferase beta subunit
MEINMSKTEMVSMDKERMGEIIAQNIAVELERGSLVNLGLGLPTQVADYVTPEQQVVFHAENGLIGTGRALKPDEVKDPDVIASSGYPTDTIPGASFFDSSISFGIIRGGHLDATILGAMQVDESGNIANYKIPGSRVVGMGGAMDLCTGAKQVIVATYHTQKGAPKILKQCTLPLTAQNAVTKIVTEKAIIDVTPEGLVLRKYNPMFTVEQILEETDASLIVADNLSEMQL